MMTILATFFAACALLVTAIGLYGTLAYATVRRTSEIGIRMALGARRVQVAGMVFRQNLLVAMAGTITGLNAALVASRALASFLYLTSARDPWVMAGSILALAIIGRHNHRAECRTGGFTCARELPYLTSARDPWVMAGSILALAIIASAASLLPALKAARIEPMNAIRCE